MLPCVRDRYLARQGYSGMLFPEPAGDPREKHAPAVDTTFNLVIGAPLPFSVVDLILRPQIRAGVAMAVEAELHRQGFGLVAERHFVHVAVTARAADALGDVNAAIPRERG